MTRAIANNVVFRWMVGRLYARTFIAHITEYPPAGYGDCLCTSCKVCRWHMSKMKPALPEARLIK